SQTTRLSDPRSPASRTQRKLNVSVPNLLVQRVTIGTVGVLCLLDATVPLRDEAATWLPDPTRPLCLNRRHQDAIGAGHVPTVRATGSARVREFGVDGRCVHAADAGGSASGPRDVYARLAK
ncbi:MAG: hypothetical protein M3070_17750, partial [Actinomycetota bacterium]|nr:hypothetical protein [Actinomycetota bacterium]